jgi:hypothetical protein
VPLPPTKAERNKKKYHRPSENKWKRETGEN